MITAAKEICPRLVDSFRTISFSRGHRIGELELNKNISILCYYSLALDESCDIKDTVQLVVFLRGVDDNFNVIEEFLDLETLEGRTTGDDIFHAVSQVRQKFCLDWQKLVCVATDGAPAIVGE